MEEHPQKEVRIIEATTDADYALGHTLFQEYAAAIDVDLCFQNFSAELRELSVMYGPPLGALLVARVGADAVGCVGVRRFQDEICEMKRLYVRPPYRGRRMGRQLAERVAMTAADLGYTKMVLDTLASMEEAYALYLSMGFQPASAYYRNPLPDVRYLALDLRELRGVGC